MLDPDYLFNVADDIVELYEELNTFAVNDICRRLVNTDFRLSGSMEWQYRMLQEAGMSRQEINKKIAQLNGKSENEVQSLFEDSSYKSFNADMKIYKAAGLTPLPFGQSQAMLSVLQSVYDQTNGSLQNLTRTTADVSQKLLIDTMSKVQFRVLSGQQSYNQAIREAINEIASDGIKVSYNGMERRLESVVRTAVLTGVNQASAKTMMQTADEMGCDCVLTTAHLGARTGEGYKGHVNWQGRVYSRKGQQYPEEEKRIGYKIEPLKEATGYEKVDGLCGANCRHNMRPWIIGHSSNPYVDGDGNPKIDTEENRKIYEASQKQRARERAIRDSKRKLQALQSSISACAESDVKDMLQSDYDKVALKLRRQQDDYKKFCTDNNLQTQNERTQVALWGKSEARKAYNAGQREFRNEQVTNGSKNSIMNNTTKEKSSDVRTVGKINRDIYKCITEDIKTDEVIITDERIQHIKDRHPNDYERFYSYLTDIVENPRYIIETKRPNTALILKDYKDGDEVFKTILRLTTSSDNPDFKNSIITFMKIDDKEWNRLLKNKRILYKSE